MAGGRDRLHHATSENPEAEHVGVAAPASDEREVTKRTVSAMTARDAVITALGVGSAFGSIVVLPFRAAALAVAASAGMLALLIPRLRWPWWVCGASLLVLAWGTAVTRTTQAVDNGLRAAISELRRDRDAAAIRTAVMEYVNGERLVAGTAALDPHDDLEAAGQAVARRDAVIAAAGAGSVRGALLKAGWNRVGESVATVDESEAVLRDLLDEPREHAVMTSRRFTHIGVGVAFDPNGVLRIHAVVAGRHAPESVGASSAA